MGTARQNRYEPVFYPDLASYSTVEEQEWKAKLLSKVCRDQVQRAFDVINDNAQYYSISGEAKSIYNDLLLMYQDLVAAGYQNPYSYQVLACRAAAEELAKMVRDFKPQTVTQEAGVYIVKPPVQNKPIYTPVWFLVGSVAVLLSLLIVAS